MSPKTSPPDAWTLDELAQKANDELGRRGLLAKSGADSRMAETITSRNLRRLVSVGAVSAPAKLGREAYYGSHHLEEVIAARELMSQGFSSSVVKSLREKSAEDAEPILFASGLDSTEPSNASRSFSMTDGHSAMQLSAGSFEPSDSLDFGDSRLAPTPSGTDLATDFLDTLGSSSKLSSRSAPARPLLASSRLFSARASGVSGVLSGSDSSGATAFLTSSALSQAYSKSADALWTEPRQGSMEALERAESQALKRASASLGRAAIDVQPWPGLRMTVSADASSGPLTDAQKSQALAALETSWSRARMMARMGLDQPGKLDLPDAP